MKKVLIISTDDWIDVRFNGEQIYEGHSISKFDLEVILGALGIKSKLFEIEDVNKFYDERKAILEQES